MTASSFLVWKDRAWETTTWQGKDKLVCLYKYIFLSLFLQSQHDKIEIKKHDHEFPMSKKGHQDLQVLG